MSSQISIVQYIEQNAESIRLLTFSKPVQKDFFIRIRIRPFLSGTKKVFQAEQYTQKQTFHKNMEWAELVNFANTEQNNYKSVVIKTLNETASFLTGTKGNRKVLFQQNPDASKASVLTTHNREKNYLIKEGTPVPFLEEMGVMNKQGKVLAAKYDKFRQINRFLEYIDDILDTVLAQKEGDKKNEISIIDFGCGKSYLTFAVYHYLTKIRKLKAKITGLDLKQDVIDFCNNTARKLNYEGLSFYCSDIAQYKGKNDFDIIITLHACDTATDYALAQAVQWKTKAILSVPCCQHELNAQLTEKTASPVLSALLNYGIIKERFAALATDAMRAELLKQQGYDVQLLEFIDMSHTPKNILIRAVYKGIKKEIKDYEALKQLLCVNPTLEKLINPSDR